MANEGDAICQSCGQIWEWEWSNDYFLHQTERVVPKQNQPDCSIADVWLDLCTCGAVFAVETLDEHGHFVFSAQPK